MALSDTLEEHTTQKKSYSKKGIFSFLFDVAKKNKKRIAVVGASTLALGGIFSMVPVMTSQLLSAVQTAVGLEAMTTAVVGWAIGYAAFENIVNYTYKLTDTVRDFFYRRFRNQNLEENIRKSYDLPYLFQRKMTEKKISDVVHRIADVSKSVLDSSFETTANLTSFLISSAILLGTSPLTTLGLLGVTGVKTGLSFWLNKKMQKQIAAIEEKESNYNALMRDDQANAMNIKDLNREEIVLVQIKARNEEVLKERKSVEFKRKLIEAGMVVIDTLSALMITLPAAYRAIATGDLGYYALLTGSAYRVMYGGSNVVRSSTKTMMEYNRMKMAEKMLEYNPALRLKTGEKFFDHIKNSERDSKVGEICLENISFGYPEGDKQIFDNFNLTIKPGQHVAIIGESNTGKSTLVDLMRHRMDVQSGKISIDGINVQDADPKSLNEQFCFVEQKAEFNEQGNLLDNIRPYKTDANEEDIINALKCVRLWDELGGDEKCMENCSKRRPGSLSTGQRQRLEIARKLLKPARVMILDEPTANLDVNTQKYVLNNILKNTKDRTVVFVSHVPAEIAVAERVLVLDKGKIVADGSPTQLLSQSEFFRNLYLDYNGIFQSAAREKAEEAKKEEVQKTALSEHKTESIRIPLSEWVKIQKGAKR